MSGALEAKIQLEELAYRKDRLADVTEGGEAGLVHAGRITRQWVEDPDFGVPFLTSTSILQADLSDLRLISKRAVRGNPKLIIRRGYTLITRAGTIGRMSYARADMDGMACTEDVLRVVPDGEQIAPGYLYAFLSSRFGISLVTSGTYGAIVRHIEPQHIADLPVPRLGDDLEARAHELVERAAVLRSEASLALSTATSDIESEIGAPNLGRLRDDPRSTGNVVSIGAIHATHRLEAFFFNPFATDVDQWIDSHPNGSWRLGEVASVFDVPPFKHIYVGPKRGVPFFTSGDLFRLDRVPEKYLSRTRTKDLQKYILESGWVLLARSGQLGGIIGRPQFADSALHRASTSDHVIRVVPSSSLVPAGYLYAYLSTPTLGYTSITRTMTGASVPALWPKYLNELRIVKASTSFMVDIDTRVRDAFEDRVRATGLEAQARSLVERTIEGAT